MAIGKRCRRRHHEKQRGEYVSISVHLLNEENVHAHTNSHFCKLAFYITCIAYIPPCRPHLPPPMPAACPQERKSDCEVRRGQGNVSLHSIPFLPHSLIILRRRRGRTRVFLNTQSLPHISTNASRTWMTPKTSSIERICSASNSEMMVDSK